MPDLNTLNVEQLANVICALDDAASQWYDSAQSPRNTLDERRYCLQKVDEYERLKKAFTAVALEKKHDAPSSVQV